MHVDIKTSSLEPLRHTFSNVARRLGADKPASRYQEGTFDVQATTNFHYRPFWAPEYELYDTRRTAIQMHDWYAFKDPRQFYYGAYTLARARQQDTAEKNFDFVEKRDLVASIPQEWREKARRVLVPLRHLEWGANMNNCYITGYGYGTAITQATMFNTMDRLGIAQYLTRIGLALDGNAATSLDEGKQAWLIYPMWQRLRHMIEDMFVTHDWFELFVAQNFALDGVLYPLVYNRFDAELSQHGGSALAMLTEFMVEWYADSTRWVDATVKTAAAESAENKALISSWTKVWSARSASALQPLSEYAFGETGNRVLMEVQEQFNSRAKKLGFDL